MAGRDLNRAYDIKRLFDRMLDKVDPELNDAGRRRQAESLMDACVGTEWRGESKLPGIEVLVVSGDAVAKEPEEFYDRLHKAMRDEGLAHKDEGGLDEPQAKKVREDETPALADTLINRITKTIVATLRSTT